MSWSANANRAGLDSSQLREVVVAIERMFAFGNGGLFIAFAVLAVALAAYAIYYMIFRLGK